MKALLLKWLLPILLDAAIHGAQRWAEDTETTADDDALKAVHDWLEYMTGKSVK